MLVKLKFTIAGMDSKSEHTLMNRVVQRQFLRGCTLDVVYYLVIFGCFFTPNVTDWLAVLAM